MYCAICDCLYNNWPSSHHKLFFLPSLISLLFSGQLLTLCKCGIDTMAPVEHTKWMASTWGCTLNHSCVHWASQSAIDCSIVCVFTVELLWTVFDKLLPPPTLPAHTTPLVCPPPKLRWPKIGAHLQKMTWNGLKSSKKRILSYAILIQ